MLLFCICKKQKMGLFSIQVFRSERKFYRSFVISTTFSIRLYNAVALLNLPNDLTIKKDEKKTGKCWTFGVKDENSLRTPV